MTDRVIILCKKISDLPEEKNIWFDTSCSICGRKDLRLTARTWADMLDRDVTLCPVCFECAMHGPEAINDVLDTLDGLERL